MAKLAPSLNHSGWDEMFSKEGVRDSYSQVFKTLQSLSHKNLTNKQQQTSDLFMNQ